MSYHVEVNEQTIRIDAGARIAELILRSLDGTFDKVVWREDLHRFILDGSGTVRANKLSAGGTYPSLGQGGGGSTRRPSGLP